MRALRLFAVGLLALAAAAAPPDAPAAGSALTHVVLMAINDFAPGEPPYPPVRINEGDSVLAVNLEYPSEQPTHNLVHDAPAPLFGSRLISTGETAPVVGVDELEPGTYPFLCSVHPTNMRGVLEVVAVLGEPAA